MREKVVRASVFAAKVAELSDATSRISTLETALRELIPIAENEYPEGDHSAVDRARAALASVSSDAPQ